MADPKYDPAHVTTEAPPPPEGAEEIESNGSSRVFRIRSDETPELAPGADVPDPEPLPPKHIEVGQATETGEARS